MFYSKYKNTLGPQVVSFVEDLLDMHGVDDEDVVTAVEHLAREYNRQDGVYSIQLGLSRLLLVIDAEMVVRLDVLKRVYENMQNSRNDPENGYLEEGVDVDKHLFFIDAFEVPLWHWSPERNTFEKLVLR